MRAPLIILVLFFSCIATAQQHPTEVYLGPPPVTVNDVIKLTRAHVGEELIIQELQQNNKHFVLSSNDLIRLKNAGVSDRVVRVMISPGPVAPSTAPVAPAAPAPRSALHPALVAANPSVPSLPSEPGLYVLEGRQQAKILGQPVTFERTGSRLVSGVTLHIKAAHNNIQVPGAHAQTLTGSKPKFAFIPSQQETANGVTAGDLLLIKLERHGDRRQIEVGAFGAGRGSSGVSITHQLQAVRSEPAPGTYEITPADPLSEGEYAIYLQRGEGLPALLYDFSVQNLQ
jgi:uncharacterized Zn-binding protein involved in type VI secretion